jgi:hypothetical protein
VTRLLKTEHVSIEGDLDIDLDGDELVGAAAKAIAEDVKERIPASSGARWNKTGHLRGGVAADRDTVIVPSDRLADPELAARFAAEVLTDDAIGGKHVDDALSRAVDDALKRGGR